MGPGSNQELGRERLTADLQGLGLMAGATVLVHSSLSGLGWVTGGAETVIGALLDTVPPDGTVLFPTLTGSERDSPAHPPVMDVRSASCWTGRIPRTSLSWPGAGRSLHPTHSVAAIGAEAALYTKGHECVTTPCGPGSPYTRLMESGGKILLLGGVTQASNTSLHALEELANVPYHLQSEVTNGIVIDITGREQVVANRLHRWGWQRNFLKVQPILERSGAIRVGMVGRSLATLIDAGVMRNVLLPLLLDDPLFLLSEEARTVFKNPH